jgi:hypothetical protein
MSIIMESTGHLTTADTASRYADEIDPDLRSLLDHIAVELAGEYVRLMEPAAQADISNPEKPPAADLEEGLHQ